MNGLIIIVFLYAIWRIYVNYKEDIKIEPEITLAIGAIITFFVNIFFKYSIVAVSFQIGLVVLIARHIIKSNKGAINK